MYQTYTKPNSQRCIMKPAVVEIRNRYCLTEYGSYLLLSVSVNLAVIVNV
jgi:hypothetical protein